MSCFKCGLGIGVLFVLGTLVIGPAEPSGLRAQDKVEKDKVEKDKVEKDKSEPKLEPVTTLKERLKKAEAELLKIRTAMLKDVDDELKKIDDAIKAAEKAMEDAKNDREARQKALADLTKARSERQRVQQIRFEVEHLLNIMTPPAFRIPPDQRIGLHTAPVPAVLTAQFKLEKNKGLVVDRVDPKSAAEGAGIQVNDVLLKIADKPVPGENFTFRKFLAELDPDKPFDVVLLRQGKEETIKGLKIPAESPK
jgi:hypothetical protein